MRRTLSWLIAGTLVAGIGGASMANSTDTFIPIQDPPEISMGSLTEFYGTADTSRVVDRILPSASKETVRDGFTTNADSDAITRADEFSFDDADSDSLKRVAQNGTETSAPYYRQMVQVRTNGPTASVERVGYCLVNTADTEAGVSSGTFKFYDDADPNGETPETNDIERSCGFNDDAPKAEGNISSAANRSVISIEYKISTDTFRIINSGSQHKVLTDDTNRSEASWDGQTLTVFFAFKPSHGLVKRSDDWIIRAAAQDQPAEQLNGEPGQTNFEPQMAQAFWGDSGNFYQGELTSDETTRSDWRELGVGYYGAIITERANVSYGTIRKDSSSVVTGIVTGRYIANNASELWIHASDFTATGAGGSSLDYTRTDTPPGKREVLFQCSPNSDDGSTTLGSDSVVVFNTAAKLNTADISPSTSGDNPENPEDFDPMSCKLTYGGGAKDAAQVYSNNVVLSIVDKGNNGYVPPIR